MDSVEGTETRFIYLVNDFLLKKLVFSIYLEFFSHIQRKQKKFLER